MKALLLRVGIDSGYGSLSPVFEDFSYEYIPIYYKNKKEPETKEKRTYFDIKCFSKKAENKSISSYVPLQIQNKVIHLDPEFDTFTYGDPTMIKRLALLKLKENDLLVFYLGGVQINNQSQPEKGVYIFGYFTVRKIYDWNNLNTKEKKELTEKSLYNNAHLRSSKSQQNLVIVEGDHKKSKQLQHCIKISSINTKGKNPPYLASEKMKNLLNIRDSIVRSVPLWIQDEPYISNLKKLLNIS
ncbi:MAG: hypothetical protein JSS63_10575 [Bacteroidetes bacterium]|nr:hypothetical protein [Bacteroidota bacterium]